MTKFSHLGSSSCHGFDGNQLMCMVAIAGNGNHKKNVIAWSDLVYEGSLGSPLSYGSGTGLLV